MATVRAMAFLWSRLALAALLASVAAAAGASAPRETNDLETPQLACAPREAPIAALAIDELPEFAALVAVAADPFARPEALTGSPLPLTERAAVAVDVLPFAPKTSPPVT